jgi:hypothetical protein
MMPIILTIALLYLALLIVTIIHETGHGGTIKIKRFFPVPEAQSNNARYRYGGLIFNGLTAAIIMYFKPESMFVQLIGAVSFLYTVLYLVFGSILPEPSERAILPKGFAIDDVPNKRAPIAITIAIIMYLLMSSYYLTIARQLIIGG